MDENRIPRRTLAWLIVGTLAVSAGLAASLLLLFRSDDRDPQEVVEATQDVIRQRFPQAAVIRFAPLGETHVESTDDAKYLVSGWLEIVTQDGERAKFDFSCSMLVLPGGQWVSERVDLVPRQ